MFNPVSTYRIQFHKRFTFQDFLKNSEYFIRLGISSIYASPIFEAAPGSMHGYDVTNPHRINPEIGDDVLFEKVSGLLMSQNIGWVQDIVPNHMAFHNNNVWLMDVLEKGRKSKYAGFFDVDFNHPGFNGRLMVPFLGKETVNALNDKELVVGWMNGNFVFRYFDFWFPFSYEAFRKVLWIKESDIPRQLKKMLSENDPGSELPENFYDNEWNEIRKASGKLYSQSEEFRLFIDQRIGTINSDTRIASELLELQNYRLCYWKDSLEKINYRRFFTVNSLICLSMEDDRIFEGYHTFIKREADLGRFNGLRVDHVDGLQKPVKYLEQLRLLTGDQTYIVTEKILGLEEELPLNLPIQGTSGYDYLGTVNNLFTCTENYPLLRDFYVDITGITDEPEEIIYRRKKFILTRNMSGEWENLARLFDESSFITYGIDISRESMKDAIGEFLILFPVYKIYADTFPLSGEESRIMKEVFRKSLEKNPHLEKPIRTLQNLFLEQSELSEENRQKTLDFMLRCLQFTGPLMAKGVEDTVMYYYNCFICHNEVGDHSSSEGISVSTYHRLMRSRQRNWPMSMNGTSTHDTKRGEDVRARLNVISELPDEWMKYVRKWMKINEPLLKNVKGKIAPDRNEEYFIYQTLTGAVPFDGKVDGEFLSRIDEYLVKALREAKTNSDWNESDEEYENSVKEFTRGILQDGRSFLKSFIPFQKKIASFGIINSLSQLLLKSASPGIPDYYQGTELWDLSLVDPDNRRAVDYSLREKMLGEIRELHQGNPFELTEKLWRTREDGRIKLWMTWQLLEERRRDPDLFLHGSYIPLQTTGILAGHVIAFARVYKNRWFIAVAPLFVASIDKKRKEPLKIKWGNTALILPDLAPSRWVSSSSPGHVEFTDRIKLSDIMEIALPVFLKGEHEPPSRFAGVLAHISSLPGKYGTGDLGNEAYDFADLLHENGQAYWQILPFNPVGEGYAWSPYSSVSAFAGNTMFISPDLLVSSRLLNDDSISRVRFQESGKSDFRRAIEFREMLSDEAFTGFFCNPRTDRLKEFEDFQQRQHFWLGEFALFNVLKREYDNAPWNEWPSPYRNRNIKKLQDFSEKYESEIKKEKFMQFIFNNQWTNFKNYCNNKGIRLIGDMSFYVNYDSVEVWAHPELFKLDKKKWPVTVAGVPPDYFSETGQLWNMPVYDWDTMKKDRYSWWINRVKRNIELCDVARFDHFRGFSEYWEVPFGEETAVKGKWTTGPGHDFFEKIREAFPHLPFIAEDLGSIDEKVLKLRDDFNLPGMTILQFAFGDNTAHSAYIPHNFVQNCIAYTGTHDNNTVRGWYKNELAEKYRKEVSDYAGHKVSEATCHEDFIKMAYASVAKIAIIPLQDLLGLDESARLNKPSTTDGNWEWKMKKGDPEKLFSEKIRKMVRLYGRI